MSLYSISGIGCDNCDTGCVGDDNYIGGRRQRRARRQARRARRKARRTGENCKGRRGLAITLAPARNAYLALIRLNFKKLAVKLGKATSTPEGRAKIHGKWCSVGGNGRKLQNAIDKAYAKYKRKRGIVGYMDEQELGMIGVAVTAIVASAFPIIKALAPLVKQFGGEKASEIAEQAEGVAEAVQPSEQNEQPAEQPADSGEVGAFGINASTIALVGGGALALYFLLKKKK